MANDKYLSGQPDARRPTRFTDQHGRKWSGIIEIKTGAPCSPLSPIGFNPPLKVPGKYMRFDPLEPSSVFIDYAAWIADLEQGKRLWDRKLVARAQTLYGEQAGKHIRKPPAELLQAVGELPPAVEPVQAAASGNRWILGLSHHKPEWAKKFFPDTPVKSVHQPRDRYRRAEINEAWRDEYPDAEDEAGNTPAPAGAATRTVLDDEDDLE